MITMRRLLLFFAFLALLSGCRAQKEAIKIQLNGETQGTYYAITYFDEQNRNLQTEIDSVFDAINHSASLWDSNSLISRINANDPDASPDAFLVKNFRLATRISEETDGYFDFTIGPLVQAWGFGLKKRDSMTAEKVQELLPLVDYHKMKLVDGKIVKENPKMQLDFNAIAQGITVDELADLLMSKDIERFLIDVGGEIYAHKTKSDGSLWKVGIEQPSKQKDEGRTIQQIVTLKNQGLATSGSYRNFYEIDGKRYSHVIDPKTGYPVNHQLLSVTVLAPDAGLADGYATAFLVMGVDKAVETMKKLHGVDAFFISATENGGYETFATEGFRKIMSE
jgi:thiamine biosynthesis lipoprotein